MLRLYRKYWLSALRAVVCTLLVAGSAAGSAGHAADPAKTAPVPYMSDKGYQITPPAGWYVMHPEGAHADVVFMASTPDDTTDAINVFVKKNSDGETVDSIPTAIDKAYAAQFEQFKKLGDCFLTVSGEKAYVVTFTALQGSDETPTYMRQLFVIHNGRAFIVTDGAALENRSLRDPKFIKCFSTLRFTDGVQR